MGDFVGIYSDSLYEGDAAQRDRELDAYVAAGIGIVRQQFDWWRIQGEPGTWDTSGYDDLVLRAARRGLEIMPILENAPRWATNAPVGSQGIYPPRNMADFGQFAGRLARRYGPGGTLWREHPDVRPVPIRAWQVWNEPNLWFFWGTWPDPVAYTAMLRAVSDAIKAADPGAEIVAAGLPESAIGVSRREFLGGMYWAGAASSFDTMAAHPYASDTAHVIGDLERLRALMAEFGDNKSIWVTEYGWATQGFPIPWRTDEPGQARNVGESIRRFGAEQSRLGIRGFVYFKWRDVVHPEVWADWPAFTGLFRVDGSAKPAFEAFRSAVASLQLNPRARGPTAGRKTGAPTCRWRRFQGRERFVGVLVAHPLPADHANRSCLLSRLAAAHVGVLRQPFRWDLIAGTSGRYRLRSYDDLVLAAAAHGIAVMPTIVGLPRRPAALTALIRALTMRYGPGGSLWHRRPALRALPIRSWQIGDSPNTAPEYRSAAGATRYARLLTAARRGVAGVDPRAEIVSGGLQARRGAVVARRYLHRLVRNGGIASVDSVAVNLPHGDLRQALGVVRDIRRALGKRRLWLRVTRVKYTMQRSRALARAQIVRSMRALRVRGIVYETPPPG